MGLSSDTRDSESRLAAYVEALTRALGHADRVAPFRSYGVGLLRPGARKSVEPMAARIAPERVEATHQSLHHFISKADWSDAAVLAAVRVHVLPLIAPRGAIRGWMIDDTAIPKKGTPSVGVARPYCGQLGKQDNYQIAVTLSLATDAASLPIAHRLYLPQAWSDDAERRARAGVPDDITFHTKPQIARAQIRAARAAGVPSAPVLGDAGSGVDTKFRDGITELSLPYVLGIPSSASLWPGRAPVPPKSWKGRGRPPALVRRDDAHKPGSAKPLAARLPKRAWRRVPWRAGSTAPLTARFAAVRVRPAHRDDWQSTPRQEEWFLVEWPADKPEPTKDWLATLPETTRLRALVALAKRRWRIERDDQDRKQDLELGHDEGRGWRGFHHHATLCIAAYGFLVAERAALPPSADRWPLSLQVSRLPATYRPRGAAHPP